MILRSFREKWMNPWTGHRTLKIGRSLRVRKTGELCTIAPLAVQVQSVPVGTLERVSPLDRSELKFGVSYTLPVIEVKVPRETGRPLGTHKINLHKGLRAQVVLDQFS